MDIPIKYVALDYFPEFKCLAEKCHYSCCYQWRVDINRPDYMKIKNLRASKEIRQIVDNEIKRVKDNSTRFYAKMIMREDGNCPFLGKDRLCNLQKECGYNVLPEVCKNFPRSSNWSQIQWEQFCSTGCEQVVNLLLDRPQGLRLIEVKTKENPSMDEQVIAKKISTRPALEFYKEIQMLFMGILQNRKYSLSHRILLLGLAAQNLDKVQTKQEAIAFLQKSISLLEYNPQLEQQLCNLQTDKVGGVLVVFKQMLNKNIQRLNEIRDEYFDDMMNSIHKNLGVTLHKQPNNSTKMDLVVDMEKYESAKHHFELISQTDYLLENVMVNLMITNQFPQKWVDDKTSVWEQYLNFAIEYNILQTLCIGYMADKENIESLVHCITICSRILEHNARFRKILVNNWKAEKLDTLAYIAYLIG